MEQFVTKMLNRHGYTTQCTTFEEFGDGEWAVWVREESTGEERVAIGSDERFIILRSAQHLKDWLDHNM